MFLVFTLKRLLLFLLAFIILLCASLLFRQKPARAAAAMGAAALPTLILDPGHGGEDGGAVSILGGSESAINLDIALKARALSEFLGFPVMLTRSTEELSYPEECKTVASRKKYEQRQRVEIINEAGNVVLLSIHQNSFPSPKPFGPQAFYTEHESARSFGLLVQEYLNAALCPKTRRVAAPASEDIYLMKNISCPGVLAECGFLSNKNEAKLLDTDSYRLKTACALMGAYAMHLSTLDEIG